MDADGDGVGTVCDGNEGSGSTESESFRQSACLPQVCACLEQRFLFDVTDSMLSALSWLNTRGPDVYVYTFKGRVVQDGLKALVKN